ncbi:hypothetical protein AAG570_010388 [Ranatra chinensis]|uniref:Uncharacterized protein n=1 Tax=Ranatra chinensis TaxID=642074 RepID=A0ABD0Z4I3_9HEMI
MAYVSRRRLFLVAPSVWCIFSVLSWSQASGQLDGLPDSSYLDPGRLGSHKKIDYGDGLSEGLLDRFLETQDPKYFRPELYPERLGPDGETFVRQRDGTPGSLRTDYIPSQELRDLLYQVDLAMSQQCTANVEAQWNFETNVNDATQLRAIIVGVIKSFGLKCLNFPIFDSLAEFHIPTHEGLGVLLDVVGLSPVDNFDFLWWRCDVLFMVSRSFQLTGGPGINSHCSMSGFCKRMNGRMNSVDSAACPAAHDGLSSRLGSYVESQ